MSADSVVHIGVGRNGQFWKKKIPVKSSVCVTVLILKTKLTFVRKDLSKCVIVWGAFKAMLHHSIANHFSGALMIANHDTLVHNDALGLGASSDNGDTDDVEF